MKKILQKIILILIVVLLSILFSTKIIVNSYQEQNKIKNLNVTNDKNRKIIQHIVDFNGFIIASVLD
jgi:hypothetical protein